MPSMSNAGHRRSDAARHARDVTTCALARRASPLPLIKALLQGRNPPGVTASSDRHGRPVTSTPTKARPASSTRWFGDQGADLLPRVDSNHQPFG